MAPLPLSKFRPRQRRCYALVLQQLPVPAAKAPCSGNRIPPRPGRWSRCMPRPCVRPKGGCLRKHPATGLSLCPARDSFGNGRPTLPAELQRAGELSDIGNPHDGKNLNGRGGIRSWALESNRAAKRRRGGSHIPGARTCEELPSSRRAIAGPEHSARSRQRRCRKWPCRLLAPRRPRPGHVLQPKRLGGRP